MGAPSPKPPLAFCILSLFRKGRDNLAGSLEKEEEELRVRAVRLHQLAREVLANFPFSLQ